MSKLTKQQDLEICEALTKTFHAYEDLIKDTEGELGKWENFGNSNNCRLCRATGSHCSICPIQVVTYGVTSCGSDVWESGIDPLRDALYNENIRRIKRVAKARLKDLIKVARRKGYTYE